MENNTANSIVAAKKRSLISEWLGSYIVAGLTIYFARNFSQTSADDFIILVIAILCGYLYRKVKNDLRFGNNLVKTILAFVVVEMIGSFLIGFLTSLF